MGWKEKLLGLKSTPQTPAPERWCAYEQAFTQSKAFRGHKKFHISYYRYKPAEDGIKAWRASGSIVDGAEILLSKIIYMGDWFIEVRVNGFLIGSVMRGYCSEEQLQYLSALEQGHIVSAHVRVEYENIVSKNRVGKLVTNEREKFSLFLKADI